MPPIPFIWTNDDISYGRTPQLERQLAFLDRFDLRGVFFVVPRNRHDGRDIDEDADLMRAIERARGAGHEFYQHGHIHTAFESGVPETWMLDMDPATRRMYDEKRLEIEQQHTLDALMEMLDAGRQIWRRAFGEESVGYRPGWGAFCGNLYRAMSNLGFEWCSARITCPTSWKWSNGKWDEPMEVREAVPAAPTRIDGVTEYPMAGDYAFHLPDESKRLEAMADLAVREMEALHQRGWPMIVCSHWHGLEANGGTGYAVHEKLLPALLESGKVQPMTMAELHASAAAQDVAAPAN